MANFPTGVPPIEVVRAYWKLIWPACCNLKGQLPPKTLICLLHSLAALVSSKPTSCFVHEQPFSVANAGQPTSFSIGALYTSTGGTPCKNLPLSVVRIYYILVCSCKQNNVTVDNWILAFSLIGWLANIRSIYKCQLMISNHLIINFFIDDYEHLHKSLCPPKIEANVWYNNIFDRSCKATFTFNHKNSRR